MIKPVISTAVFFTHGKISELEKNPAPSNEEYLKQEAQIVNLQREVISSARSMDRLNITVNSQFEELEVKTNKIASLEVDILTKKMQVCCLQGTNDSQTDKIVTLKHKIEEFEDKVTSFAAEIGGKSREIARLTSDTERMSKEITSKSAQVLSLSTEVKKKTDQIAQIEVERINDKNM